MYKITSIIKNSLKIPKPAHPQPTLSTILKHFQKSHHSSLCIVSDELTLDIYQEIETFLSKENGIFIGNDISTYLQKSSLKNTQIVVIDFSQIALTDSLNDLLEREESQSSIKIIGLLSKTKYQNTARSFQCRWDSTFQLPFSSSIHPTIPHTLSSKAQNTSSPHQIPIFNQLHRLQSIDPQTLIGKSVELLGADPQDSCVKYTLAQLQNKGITVHCRQGWYPEKIQEISLSVADPKFSQFTLIHKLNFQDIEGPYYVQNKSVKQGSKPQSICICSELSSDQWQQLGYILTHTPTLSVTILKGLPVPPETERHLSQESESNPQVSHNQKQPLTVENHSTLLAGTQPIWIQSGLPNTSSLIQSMAYNHHPNIHHLRHPTDTLSEILGTHHHSHHQTTYTPTFWTKIFQDPKAIIFINTQDIHELLQMELEITAFSQKIYQNGHAIPIAAKLIFISNQKPTIFSGKQYLFTPSESSLKEYLSTPLQTASSIQDKKTILSKALQEELFLILKGSPFTGKQTILKQILMEQKKQLFSLTASPTLHYNNDIETTLLKWINTSRPSTLIIHNFTILPSHYWQLLQPNQNNELYIHGQWHRIPKTHTCVLIDTHHEKAKKQILSKQLPLICFKDYSKAETETIIRGLTDHPKLADWGLKIYQEFEEKLEHPLTFLDLSELFHRYHHYSQTTSPSLAQAHALYDLASCYFHMQNLPPLKSLLSIHEHSWDTICSLKHKRFHHKNHSSLTQDQAWIYDFLTTHYQNSPYPQHPILWIEGEAGCGKDYVVNKVFDYLNKNKIRVKGSDLQAVLTASHKAQKNGWTLIIEEADLLSSNILESLINSSNSHPHFSILATVNGQGYADRQSISFNLLSKSLIIHCNTITPTDLQKMLQEKYRSSKLTAKNINDIIIRYKNTEIQPSPRDIFSIVEDFLNSKDSLNVCWDHKISALQSLRKDCTTSVNTTENKSYFLEEKKQKNHLEDTFQKTKVKPNFIKSGIRKHKNLIIGQSSHNLIPLSHLTILPNGQQCHVSRYDFPNSPQGEGIICLDDPRSLKLVTTTAHIEFCQIPLPGNSIPKTVTCYPTDTPPQTLHHFFQDQYGRYQASLPPSLRKQIFSLGISFIESTATIPPSPSSQPPPCYQHYKLKNIPESIQDCLAERKTKNEEKVKKIEILFKSMTYKTGPQIDSLYKDLKGEARVNRFFELNNQGCCYEFSQAFAAVIGSQLGFHVRICNGLIKHNKNKLGRHCFVEVLLNGKWTLFDPTPSSPNTQSIHQNPVLKSSFETCLSDFQNSQILLHKFHAIHIYSPPIPTDNDIKKSIENWCHQNHFIQSETTIKKLPCSNQNGSLNLELLHHQQTCVYNQYQLQKGSNTINIKVVLHQEDKTTNNLLLKTLLNMKIPVYATHSTSSLYTQIHSISQINWSTLANENPSTSFKKMPQQVSFSTLSKALLPKEIVTLYMEHSHFQNAILQLQDSQTALLYFWNKSKHLLPNLEWLIQILSEYPTVARKITKIELSECETLIINNCKKFSQLIQLCPQLEECHIKHTAIHKIRPQLKELLQSIDNKRIYLRLFFCEIDPETFYQLAPFFPKNCHSLSLEAEHINDNLNSSLASALIPNLKNININRYTISPTHIMDFTTQLPKYLQCLSLTECHLCDEDLKQLLTAPFQHLIEFDFNSNTITKEGAIYLAQHLPPKLIKLNLNTNNISDDGAIALAIASSESETFNELLVYTNNIHDRGALVLISHFKNLKKLTIKNNPISNAVRQILEKKANPDLS